MTPSEQRDFVLKNFKRLSSRQIAKKLELSRQEVEKIISEAKRQPLTKPAIEQGIPRSKETFLIFGFFVLALVLRLIYIHWLKATPFFEPLAKGLDDGVYHKMAQDISAGNWLGDLPYSAYRIPLYPYFLAVIYHFFGVSVGLVHVIQSLFGAFTPVLIYLICKEVFKSQRTALIGGILACFYAPFIFFENLLLGESLSIFLNLSGLLVLLKGLNSEGKTVLKLIFSGLLFGVSILFRPNTIIPVCFLAVYVYFALGFLKKRHLKGLALSIIFLAASFLAVVPVTVKNYCLHKDFLPLSAVGGVNLYIGNNPEADGKFHLMKEIGTELNEMIKNSEVIAQRQLGRALKPSEVSAYWSKKAVNFALSSPGPFLALMAKKTAFFLNNYEFPDILDIGFTSQFMPFLKLDLFGYGMIVVLGFCGIFLSWRQRNPSALLPGVFLAGYTLSVVLFFITARYRLPAAPIFMIFAAFAVHELIDALRFWKSKELMSFAVVALVSGVVVFWPVETTRFGTNYNSLAVALKNKGQYQEAEKYYRKAIEIEPDYPSPYYNLGLMYQKLGRRDEAEVIFRKYEEAKSKIRS